MGGAQRKHVFPIWSWGAEKPQLSSLSRSPLWEVQAWEFVWNRNHTASPPGTDFKPIRIFRTGVDKPRSPKPCNTRRGVWAGRGCVFRQKVVILISEVGTQEEVCSGHWQEPALPDPNGLIACSGPVWAHGSKSRGIFLSHRMKTYL